MDREYIPCEFCEVLIDFAEYDMHSMQCHHRNTGNIIENFAMSNPISVAFAISNNFSGVPINIGMGMYGVSDGEYNMDSVNSLISSLLPFAQLPDEMNLHNMYNSLRDLEDVAVPCRDINKVAPLVPSDKLNLIPSDTICPICQDIISSDARKTICNHYFCSSCIEPWLEVANKTCPVCALDLDDLYNKQNNKQNINKQNISSDSST